MPESTPQREDLQPEVLLERRLEMRLEQLRSWLKKVLNTETIALTPASADASFRRYFRVPHAGTTRVVMDAPPAQENCEPFVRIAGLLDAAGVNVPQVLAQDMEQGFLLLTDLGRKTYLDVFKADASHKLADALFKDAIKALINWQLASHADVLPDYDASELLRELNLFPDWYLARHLQVELDEIQRAELDQVFEHIVARIQVQPKTFVHRDYMPRNLMHSDPNPGVLDFQDARYGPIAYDVLSLFKDAFISWPEEQVTLWAHHYWRGARASGLPVPSEFSEFQEAMDWIGVQRHLKVLGIFARISYRDGKPQYLQDAPRFLAYLQPVIARYPELAPLASILNAGQK